MHNLRIALLLLLGASPLAAAAQVWRWVDQDGVVHLSDKPVPGAQRIELKPPVSAAREPSPAAQPPVPRSTPSRAAARSTAYSRCELVDPAEDAAFDAPEAVQLSAQVLPVLRPGDRLQATLNGEPVTDWPPNAMVHVLQQPARGTYVVTFRVVSADGRTQCQSAARSFHVRQPSLIRPGPKR